MLNKLIMKVSGACNLGCSYCYYMTDRPVVARRNMSTKTMEVTFRDFAIYLSRELPVDGGTDIYWHGGEPLLQRMEFWERVAAHQEALEAEFGIRWNNFVTTNGTLITEDLARFLKQQQWNVAISIDGPKERHDQFRVLHNRKGSFDLVYDGYRRLKDSGVEPTVLTVLSDHDGAGDETYDFFVEMEVAKGDLLLPLYNWKDEVDANARSKRLLREVMNFFIRWCQGGSGMRIRLFDSIIGKVKDGTPGLCHHEDACDEVATVEPDGSFHICDDLLAVKEQPTGLHDIFPNRRLESIAEIADSIEEVVRNRGYFGKAKQCLECNIFDICGGGCPANRWDGESFDNVSVHCGIYKGFYSVVRDAKEAIGT